MVTESAEKNKKNGDICKKMRLYLKKYNISDKGVEKPGIFRYTIKAVTLIAVKREVAARKWQVFRGANVKLGNWRQVTVRITTDYCLPIMGKGMKQRVSFSRHTRESVQSPLVVLK